ncbi:MAG: molybdopterin-dependent oxidoreductase [Anaerolineales bacterium]|nr:molybdopterin-dependent oxidoreductase [Anaerolineales bacterium]
MINLTINGKQIEVEEGTTVLNAARQNDIKIPTLCDHPNLTPYGGCRLCVVEVKGMRVPIASCTLPASNGMVIETETDSLKKSRSTILSLLFSERNHFCPFCQVSGGDCELQNSAYDEHMTHWPMQPQWTNFPVDTSHTRFILDNNRCILCRRCIRACAEMSGNFTLGVEERGSATIVVADSNVPLGESTCVSCGSCVQVCPTGALIDRSSAYLGHDKQMTVTRSVCRGCSLGCGIMVHTRDNRIVKITGDYENRNAGTLCETGRYKTLDEKRVRLTTPMKRVAGQLTATTWEDALTTLAQNLTPNKNKVAALASTRLTVESMAAFKSLFADGLGNDVVTSIEEGRPTALQAKYAEANGEAIEGKLDTLRTSDCVLLIGADLSETHEVASFYIKRNMPKGTRLIVVDPSENGMDDLANLNLKPKAGTDEAVFAALEAAIIKEGLARTEAKSSKTALKNALKICELAEEDVIDVAHMLAEAVAPVIVYGKGISAFGNDAVMDAMVRVAKLTGASDSERRGLLSVKGEANSLAAAQLKMDVPFDVKNRKVAYLAVGDDYISKRLLKSLEDVPYLVVQASYESELTDRADLVLPVNIWAEEAGHALNTEGRVQFAEAALTAPEGVRSNLGLLNEVAKLLNVKLNDDWRSALTARTSVVEIEM